jgi:hypothetical protein
MIGRKRYATQVRVVKGTPIERLLIHLGPGPAARLIPLTQPSAATRRRVLRLCRTLAKNPGALTFGVGRR